MEEISSEILIKCKKNDLEAYRLVVRHYRSFVISLLYRFLGGKYAEEVEDFAREIFIRLYDFMKKYDADRGIKFSVCVFTVVKNYCYNELSIKRLQVDPVAENKPSAGEAPEDEVLAGELKQRVE
ncbi:MAG: sigma factor, partial [Candidatus Firestonebacteria bacterium]